MWESVKKCGLEGWRGFRRMKTRVALRSLLWHPHTLIQTPCHRLTPPPPLPPPPPRTWFTPLTEPLRISTEGSGPHWYRRAIRPTSPPLSTAAGPPLFVPSAKAPNPPPRGLRGLPPTSCRARRAQVRDPEEEGRSLGAWSAVWASQWDSLSALPADGTWGGGDGTSPLGGRLLLLPGDIAKAVGSSPEGPEGELVRGIVPAERGPPGSNSRTVTPLMGCCDLYCSGDSDDFTDCTAALLDSCVATRDSRVEGAAEGQPAV